MADLVMVRFDLGDEYEIAPRGRALAESKGLEILDESPTDRVGAIKKPRRVRKSTERPAKPKTTVSHEAAKKNPEQAAVIEPAPTDKEQNR